MLEGPAAALAYETFCPLLLGLELEDEPEGLELLLLLLLELLSLLERERGRENHELEHDQKRDRLRSCLFSRLLLMDLYPAGLNLS